MVKKVIEWCPHCEKEVKILAIPCVIQQCPKCHKSIKACCLCDMDNCNCTQCEETYPISAI